MNPKRMLLVAALAAAGLLAAAEIPAAPAGRNSGIASSGPRHSTAAPASRGDFRPSHPGGHRPGPGTHWNRSHHGHSNWGWGLGLAIGVPWALGWYDPFWGGPTYYAPYAPYAYGPAYRGYSEGYACAQDEDCWRERLAGSEPAPPTTEVAPAAPGEEGGPTQRPLHLNYCDSARAWFPHVRACPGGWRLVTPDYGAAR